MRRMHFTNSGIALEDESAVPSGLPVPVAEGGTGASDPAGARVNLGVSATGADLSYPLKSNNLSDLASIPAARTNLGVSATGADATYATKAANLSDLASIATARTNLGVSATGADATYATKAANLSDLASIATARSNLGVSATGADATYATKAANLSDLASMATARANLGVSATGADATYATKAANLSDLASIPQTLVNLGLKNSAGAMTLKTTVDQPITFSLFNNERARLMNGYFKAADDGSYFYPVQTIHCFDNSSTGGYEVLQLTHRDATNPYGLMIRFPNGNPNDASHTFVRCYADAGGDKIKLLSNGGIANFAGNNVNYSDAAIKTDITPYADAELDALEAAFRGVDWGRFKYAGQTHSDWNHGPTAQGVEAAFASTAPELIDEVDMRIRDEIVGTKVKGVYAADLANIAHALLARALKRIAELERRLAMAAED